MTLQFVAPVATAAAALLALPGDTIIVGKGLMQSRREFIEHARSLVNTLSREKKLDTETVKSLRADLTFLNRKAKDGWGSGECLAAAGRVAARLATPAANHGKEKLAEFFGTIRDRAMEYAS